MGRYLVNQRYESYRDGRRFGPYTPGEVVDLEPADADWVNRDAPGTLTDADAQATSQRAAAPAVNRQHKGGKNRST